MLNFSLESNQRSWNYGLVINIFTAYMIAVYNDH